MRNLVQVEVRRDKHASLVTPRTVEQNNRLAFVTLGNLNFLLVTRASLSVGTGSLHVVAVLRKAQLVERVLRFVDHGTGFEVRTFLMERL